MLTDKNLREIFLAFIVADDIHPSANLLDALARASGKTGAELREQYRTYATYLTGRDSDPFADDLPATH